MSAQNFARCANDDGRYDNTGEGGGSGEGVQRELTLMDLGVDLGLGDDDSESPENGQQQETAFTGNNCGINSGSSNSAADIDVLGSYISHMNSASGQGLNSANQARQNYDKMLKQQEKEKKDHYIKRENIRAENRAKNSLFSKEAVGKASSSSAVGKANSSSAVGKTSSAVGKTSSSSAVGKTSSAVGKTSSSSSSTGVLPIPKPNIAKENYKNNNLSFSGLSASFDEKGKLTYREPILKKTTNGTIILEGFKDTGTNNSNSSNTQALGNTIKKPPIPDFFHSRSSSSATMSNLKTRLQSTGHIITTQPGPVQTNNDYKIYKPPVATFNDYQQQYNQVYSTPTINGNLHPVVPVMIPVQPVAVPPPPPPVPVPAHPPINMPNPYGIPPGTTKNIIKPGMSISFNTTTSSSNKVDTTTATANQTDSVESVPEGFKPLKIIEGPENAPKNIFSKNSNRSDANLRLNNFNSFMQSNIRKNVHIGVTELKVQKVKEKGHDKLQKVIKEEVVVRTEPGGKNYIKDLDCSKVQSKLKAVKAEGNGKRSGTSGKTANNEGDTKQAINALDTSEINDTKQAINALGTSEFISSNPNKSSVIERIVVSKRKNPSKGKKRKNKDSRSRGSSVGGGRRKYSRKRGSDSRRRRSDSRILFKKRYKKNDSRSPKRRRNNLGERFRVAESRERRRKESKEKENRDREKLKFFQDQLKKIEEEKEILEGDEKKKKEEEGGDKKQKEEEEDGDNKYLKINFKELGNNKGKDGGKSDSKESSKVKKEARAEIGEEKGEKLKSTGKTPISIAKSPKDLLNELEKISKNHTELMKKFSSRMVESTEGGDGKIGKPEKSDIDDELLKISRNHNELMKKFLKLNMEKNDIVKSSSTVKTATNTISSTGTTSSHLRSAPPPFSTKKIEEAKATVRSLNKGPAPPPVNTKKTVVTVTAVKLVSVDGKTVSTDVSKAPAPPPPKRELIPTTVTPQSEPRISSIVPTASKAAGVMPVASAKAVSRSASKDSIAQKGFKIDSNNPFTSEKLMEDSNSVSKKIASLGADNDKATTTVTVLPSSNGAIKKKMEKLQARGDDNIKLKKKKKLLLAPKLPLPPTSTQLNNPFADVAQQGIKGVSNLDVAQQGIKGVSNLNNRSKSRSSSIISRGREQRVNKKTIPVKGTVKRTRKISRSVSSNRFKESKVIKKRSRISRKRSVSDSRRRKKPKRKSLRPRSDSRSRDSRVPKKGKKKNKSAALSPGKSKKYRYDSRSPSRDNLRKNVKSSINEKKKSPNKDKTGSEPKPNTSNKIKDGDFIKEEKIKEKQPEEAPEIKKAKILAEKEKKEIEKSKILAEKEKKLKDKELEELLAKNLSNASTANNTSKSATVNTLNNQVLGLMKQMEVTSENKVNSTTSAAAATALQTQAQAQQQAQQQYIQQQHQFELQQYQQLQYAQQCQAQMQAVQVQQQIQAQAQSQQLHYNNMLLMKLKGIPTLPTVPMVNNMVGPGPMASMAISMLNQQQSMNGGMGSFSSVNAPCSGSPNMKTDVEAAKKRPASPIKFSDLKRIKAKLKEERSVEAEKEEDEKSEPIRYSDLVVGSNPFINSNRVTTGLLAKATTSGITTVGKSAAGSLSKSAAISTTTTAKSKSSSTVATTNSTVTSTVSTTANSKGPQPKLYEDPPDLVGSPSLSSSNGSGNKQRLIAFPKSYATIAVIHPIKSVSEAELLKKIQITTSKKTVASSSKNNPFCSENTGNNPFNESNDDTTNQDSLNNGHTSNVGNNPFSDNNPFNNDNSDNNPFNNDNPFINDQEQPMLSDEESEHYEGGY